MTRSIDLDVGVGVDAELVAQRVAGPSQNDAPRVRFVDNEGWDQRAILGARGRKIVIESIMGSVKDLAAVYCEERHWLNTVPGTEELRRRPARALAHETENCALFALCSALAHSPETFLETDLQSRKP